MSGKFTKGGDEYEMVNHVDNTKIITFQKSKQGTFFHKETPQKVKDILDGHMQSSTRLFIDLGDTKTGKSWGEIYDNQGTISRSMGQVKVPLLIKTVRSSGGGAILDHCIIRIKTTGKNGITLYKHPKYQPPTIERCKHDKKLYADVLK